MVKRIAVIGSGISGLVSAYLLSERYDVTLFEADDYLGGHTHTVPVTIDNDTYLIDTGFIVFNKKTYPYFCKLLEKLNVPIQPSEMSFSYRSDEKDLEYNGQNLNTLFADRRNLIKPAFYFFIKDILRFNKDAKKFLLKKLKTDISINEFIHDHHYSKDFIDSYLVPMMASIWSKRKEDTLNCSAYFILQFYLNHGLLESYNRPQWYVIVNGSHSYIPKLIEKFKNKIHLNTKIERLEREENRVILKSANDLHHFDSVIIATHSDQALKLLAHPTSEESHILSKISYTENDVILHTDTSILPKRKRAWASWNYLDNGNTLPTLTYYMNRLQSINSIHQFCVSVNLTEQINENSIIKRLRYAHPCLDLEAIKAQQQQHIINGKNNTYYVGSYWGYGFHEDGVKSAIDTCALLGVTL